MSETPDSGDCVGYNGFSSDVPAVLLAKLVANEIADRRYLPKLSDTEAWDAMWKEIVVPLGHKNCLRNERGVYEDQLAGKNCFQFFDGHPGVHFCIFFVTGWDVF